MIARIAITNLFFYNFRISEDRIEIWAARRKDITMCTKVTILNDNIYITKTSRITLITQALQYNIPMLVRKWHRIQISIPVLCTSWQRCHCSKQYFILINFVMAQYTSTLCTIKKSISLYFKNRNSTCPKNHIFFWNLDMAADGFKL